MRNRSSGLPQTRERPVTQRRGPQERDAALSRTGPHNPLMGIGPSMPNCTAAPTDHYLHRGSLSDSINLHSHGYSFQSTRDRRDTYPRAPEPMERPDLGYMPSYSSFRTQLPLPPPLEGSRLSRPSFHSGSTTWDLQPPTESGHALPNIMNANRSQFDEPFLRRLPPPNDVRLPVPIFPDSRRYRRGPITGLQPLLPPQMMNPHSETYAHNGEFHGWSPGGMSSLSSPPISSTQSESKYEPVRQERHYSGAGSSSNGSDMNPTASHQPQPGQELNKSSPRRPEMMLKHIVNK